MCHVGLYLTEVEFTRLDQMILVLCARSHAVFHMLYQVTLGTVAILMALGVGLEGAVSTYSYM